tara:strand:+ start:2509 stop:2922 length:414 start_codon:yes stop_codon:yes gene_type:complete
MHNGYDSQDNDEYHNGDYREDEDGYRDNAAHGGGANNRHDNPDRDISQMFKPLVKNIWKVSSIYMLWIFIHYIASHLYVSYCTPYNVIGFIASPIIVSTPHCTGIRWCITRGADTITAMWIVLGTWVATSIGGYSLS